ncbi:MAG: DedA family protein [Austwickia sp.]|nr:DedA family protein [Austwickia sp.]MBK8437562.1 DedA family protein [Austwickia sp.]MBK9102828.1 DedA family protein [Austwickia sp.]
MVETLNQFIIANSPSTWALVAVFALATLDGFFPPLPSESVVITLAAVSASTGSPSLIALGVCAAIGAFLGDNLTFLIGRHSGLNRMAHSKRPPVQRAFRWAASELHRRGGLAILVARYVPVGRVAVNLTAGASGFSRPKFIALDALAVTTWATYSVAIGALAGHWFHDHPFIAALSGICLAVLTGLAVDAILRRTGLVADTPEPVDPQPVSEK